MLLFNRLFCSTVSIPLSWRAHPGHLLRLSKSRSTTGHLASPLPTTTHPQWQTWRWEISTNAGLLHQKVWSFVCYFHTFENNLGIKQIFTKLLIGICCLAYDQHFSFNYFPENVFLSEIFLCVRPVLAALSVNGLTYDFITISNNSSHHLLYLNF